MHVKDYRIDKSLVWEGAVDEDRLKNFVPCTDGDSGHEMISVSYTHLRAHETVLDLVCRLLLEKTKKIKKKKNNCHLKRIY